MLDVYVQAGAKQRLRLLGEKLRRGPCNAAPRP